MCVLFVFLLVVCTAAQPGARADGRLTVACRDIHASILSDGVSCVSETNASEIFGIKVYFSFCNFMYQPAGRSRINSCRQIT